MKWRKPLDDYRIAADSFMEHTLIHTYMPCNLSTSFPGQRKDISCLFLSFL